MQNDLKFKCENVQSDFQDETPQIPLLQQPENNYDADIENCLHNLIEKYESFDIQRLVCFNKKLSQSENEVEFLTKKSGRLHRELQNLNKSDENSKESLKINQKISNLTSKLESTELELNSNKLEVT